MATNQVIARSEGEDQIVLEYSSTPTPDELGTHKWTMELYWFDGDLQNGRGMIEWIVGENEEFVEGIGIWTEDGELSDYDGVMSLPHPCIPLLEKAGIVVGEHFRD